jgi:hypothetical protein
MAKSGSTISAIRQLPNTISRFSFAQKERDILHEAAQWLDPRLDRLSTFPTRVMQGDWTPLNFLIGAMDGR